LRPGAPLDGLLGVDVLDDGLHLIVVVAQLGQRLGQRVVTI